MMGVYYRLGNECRDYSEFQLTKKQQLNENQLRSNLRGQADKNNYVKK